MKFTFTCAECRAATELVGRAPDGRLVCPVCHRKLGGKGVPAPVGPSETKDELDYSDYRGGR